MQMGDSLQGIMKLSDHPTKHFKEKTSPENIFSDEKIYIFLITNSLYIYQFYLYTHTHTVEREINGRVNSIAVLISPR